MKGIPLVAALAYAVLVVLVITLTPGQRVAERLPMAVPTDVNYLAIPPVVQTEPPEETMLAELSYYSCSQEEGTAACIEAHTGNRPKVGTAASRTLPAGTVLRIGGNRYEVRDFCPGCAVSGLDLFVESREEAFQLGRRQLVVTIERAK